MVMPAVKRPMARVLPGAATEANVRTAEWMSCYTTTISMLL
jgi:hypothetical protein